MKRTGTITMAAIIATALPAMAFDVPKKSSVLPGYYESARIEEISRNASDKLEGIWYYPDENLSLAIEKTDSEKPSREEIYRIVIVGTDNCATDPGSIIGYMEKTAEERKLRMWLYSGFEADLPVNPVECVATVDDGYSTILIDRPKVKMRVSANIMQFLPSIFGGLRIYPRYEKPEVKPGFRRIYPEKQSSTEILYF